MGVHCRGGLLGATSSGMESAGMESAAGPKQPAALGTNGLSLRDFLSEISNNGLDEAEECFEEREAPDGAVPFFQLASSRSGFQEPRIPDQPGNERTSGNA